MPDKEQIKTMALIVQEWMDGLTFPTDVPVMAITYCMHALLKEQEAVKPFFDEYMNPRCGKCHRRLFCVDDKDSFCSKCGQAVKWND